MADPAEVYNGWPNRETFSVVAGLTSDQYMEFRAREMALVADERAHMEYDEQFRRSSKAFPESERFNYVASQSALYFRDGVMEMFDDMVKRYTTNCTDKTSETCKEFMHTLLNLGSAWRVDWRTTLETFLEE